MPLCYRGHGDPLEDSRVVVWLTKSESDGSWGWETRQRGSYGYESSESAFKAYLAVRDALDAL